MKKTPPLVSIVVPTYNRANFLPELMSSLLAQTYQNIELVIVNDHSKDNTSDILYDYTLTHTNIKVLLTDGKGGNAARNTGIYAASGEYIALMDDDDICMPDRIQRQVKALQFDDTVYDFVISGYQIANIKGKIVNYVNYLKPLKSVGFPQRWLIKKEKLIEVGCFDVDQPSMQDVEIFWRLKEISKIKFDPNVVVTIRKGHPSITGNHLKVVEGIRRLLILHGSKMEKYEYNHWVRSISFSYAAMNDWDSAFKSIQEDVAVDRRTISYCATMLLCKLKKKKMIRAYNKIIDLYYRTHKTIMI